MSEDQRVKFQAGMVRPTFWVAIGFAILLLFWIPSAIRQNGVAEGLFIGLFWEVILIVFAYWNLKPYLTVRQWQQDGDYRRRDWSPEERGLQRGKMVVYLYRVTNGDSNITVALDELKQFGGWTLGELYNLLGPSKISVSLTLRCVRMEV